ncbi:MAG: bestrophin family protein [Bacteroidia bacterium]|nr:bestrophin family protein [Bacteroidia bacterium]
MINYNSKNWFEAISHFKSSYVIRRTMRMTLVVGLIAAGLGAIQEFLMTDFKIGIEPSIFSLLGLLLSLLLVFRLNSAYDRWWEGRKQWGALINHTRGLAVLWHGKLGHKDIQNRTFFAKGISAYVLALSDHLRDKSNHSLVEMYSEESPESIRTYAHVPNKIVRDMYERTEMLYKDGFIDGFQLNQVQPELQEFLNIQGACERIKATPIPFAHNFFIKLFVLTYCALLPFVLIPVIGWWAILMTMFVSYALIGIEFISVEIEEPFGLDCNDLPTHNLAVKIEKNVHEILEVELLDTEKEVKQQYIVIK